MKPNVDLTLNQEFRYSPTINSEETFQWISDGVKEERINPDNPITRKDFDDFANGRTIVATGSKWVRQHKLDVRGLRRHEVCYECGEELRIPWKPCPCQEKWKMENGYRDSCRRQLGYPQIIGDRILYSSSCRMQLENLQIIR